MKLICFLCQVLFYVSPIKEDSLVVLSVIGTAGSS